MQFKENPRSSIANVVKKLYPFCSAGPELPAEPTAAERRESLARTSENLLKHIPGEATGFYVIAVSAFDKQSTLNLGIIFFCSLALLVLIRWLARTSRGVMVSTIIAFFIWMLIIDNGFIYLLIHTNLPGFPIRSWGWVAAAFYTAVITILADAGIIK
jgi:hypothetical protein